MAKMLKFDESARRGLGQVDSSGTLRLGVQRFHEHTITQWLEHGANTVLLGDYTGKPTER